MEPRRGSPYDLSPLYARRPGERVRRLCHPVPRSNLAEAADSPGGPGEEVVAAKERSRFPSAATAVALAAPGFARRREPAAAATVSKTHESRGEERTHAGSHRPLGLSTSPATEAGGAHVGCRALARRLHPGRIPSRLRSPGMWGCDCYSTFRRRVSALLLGLRLALSPAWPRGMPPGRSADVTAMLCTSPPPPLYTSSVCGAHLLLPKGACAAACPDSSLSAPPPRLHPLLPSPPPSAMCVPQLRPRELKAASPGFGFREEGGFGAGRRDETGDDLSFSCLAFPSNKTFKSHKSVVSDSSFPTPPKPQAVKLNALFDEFHFEFHIKVLPI